MQWENITNKVARHVKQILGAGRLLALDRMYIAVHGSEGDARASREAAGERESGHSDQLKVNWIRLGTGIPPALLPDEYTVNSTSDEREANMIIPRGS